MQGSQAVERAIQILCRFDASKPQWTVRDLAEEIGLPRSTVYRMAAVLCEFGLLRAIGGNSRLGLGVKLIELGNVAASDMELRHVALPIMQGLRDEVGESVNLSVRYDNYRVCIEKVECTHDLRQITHIGKQVPLGVGATGKLLLAFLPAQDRERILAAWNPPAPTPLTVTDPEAMRAEIERIRERGWAMSESERLLGARSLSCPVYDHRGTVAAALTVSGASARFTEQVLSVALPKLLATAALLSRELGFREVVEE